MTQGDDYLGLQPGRPVVSPLLIVGVIMMVAPMIVNAIGGHMGYWLTYIGVVLFLAGCIHSLLLTKER